MTHTWIALIISKLISIVQAASMRERYYLQQQRIEILETALDDVRRINRAAGANPLIERVCESSVGQKE
jgi:hypothetical protein